MALSRSKPLYTAGTMALLLFALAPLILTLLLVLTACNKPRAAAPPKAAPQAPTVEKLAKGITPPVAVIKREAKAAGEEAPDLQPRMDTIDTAADELMAVHFKLLETVPAISNAEKDNAELRGKVGGLEKKNRELQADRNSLLSRLLAGLAVVAVIAGVACIWLLQSPKLAAGCGVLFIVAISAQWLLAWAVWFALGLAALIVGLAVWAIFIQGKSIAEVVSTAEAFKKRLAPEVADEVKVALTRVQSPQTTKLVKKVRVRLGLVKPAT